MKNLYSLVLSEEIVGEIDRRAYREGTNRSALINRILAEYVSFTTPEMRAQQILRSVEEMLAEASPFRLSPASDSALSMLSSLEYKYNPTVRYTVALRGDGEEIGELRVGLRTQNQLLLSLLLDFYRAFCTVEQQAIGPCSYRIEDGKFIRTLCLRTNRGTLEGMPGMAALGEIIADYIRCFDTCMKTYLRYAEQPAAAIRAMAEVYKAYRVRAAEII